MRLLTRITVKITKSPSSLISQQPAENMNKPLPFSRIGLLLFLLVLVTLSSPNHAHRDDEFLHCLSLHDSHNSNSSFSQVIYAPSNSSYSSILDVSAHNLRFTEPTTPRPLVIITPTKVVHIQAAIICSKRHGIQIRTRSGGHDFEGLSFVSQVPFVLVDMINFRSIHVDAENKVARVQVAAILGELYYKIAKKTSSLAFPAGICLTVGVGGHFSGGGYGALLRKYGLAADNIIDAQLVNVDGRVLDRKSMGEDLFWAIRGGGGASFGIITAFKIQLVPVPPRVTVCSTIKTLEQNATKLVHDWQNVAPFLPKEIFSIVSLSRVNASLEEASFAFQFLGGVDELITLLQHSYNGLGLVKEECREVSWIQSVMILGGISSSEATPEVLLNRTLSTSSYPYKYFGKIKSDYVQKPIPETGIEGIWKRLYEVDINFHTRVFFVAYGGKMSEIPETETPYPHRAGILYMMGYVVGWDEESHSASERHINWIRKLYSDMRPYVSKSPRQAYLNYRDLDIGTNKQGNTSFAQASIWGFKYFKNNFYRLAHIKAKVDPSNFFNNEQSVPLLP